MMHFLKYKQHYILFIDFDEFFIIRTCIHGNMLLVVFLVSAVRCLGCLGLTYIRIRSFLNILSLCYPLFLHMLTIVNISICIIFHPSYPLIQCYSNSPSSLIHSHYSYISYSNFEISSLAPSICYLLSYILLFGTTPCLCFHFGSWTYSTFLFVHDMVMFLLVSMSCILLLSRCLLPTR